MTKTALVVGASGIVGSATAALLVEQGWTVHGLARRPTGQDGVLPVAADLQDASATAAASSSSEAGAATDDAPSAAFIPPPRGATAGRARAPKGRGCPPAGRPWPC